MQAQRGAITYWKLGGITDPDILASEFGKLGLSDFAPARRTWLQSLKSALSDLKNAKQMIRPLKDKERDGYTIVNEDKGSHVNDYDCSASVAIDDNGWINVHTGSLDHSELKKQTAYYKGLLAGRAVTDTLVALVAKCDGIPLRPNGGVYFIPQSGLDLWRGVSAAITAAASTNEITVAELEINADTVRDIRNALQEEIDALAAETEQIAIEAQAGERLVANRINKVSEAIERIERYEGFLNETLTGCRDSVSRCTAALEVALANAQAKECGTAVFV
jgi:hypothetical protein